MGWRGRGRGLSNPILAWQEGTSKFATLEMNPKRAQKRPKETVSVRARGWDRSPPSAFPPAATLPDLRPDLLWALVGPRPDRLGSRGTRGHQSQGLEELGPVGMW